MTNQKESLEAVYLSHHGTGKYGRLRSAERGHYLADWIGQGKEVLDLGCRDGELTRFFSKGNKVTGADIDRKALELAKDKLGIETCWLDLNRELPFPTESFDVVVACEVLEHIHYPNELLANVQAVLKPGGLFLGSVPNAFRLGNRLAFLLGMEFEKDPTHLHVFSRKRLRLLLTAHFRDVSLVPVGGRILPGLPMSRRIPYPLGIFLARNLLWRSVK